MCVLCAKVGRPLTSIPTVNTTAESALVGWERRLVPRTTVLDRGFRREPGASAPGKSANFEGLQARAFAPFLRQEASTTVVLVMMSPASMAAGVAAASTAMLPASRTLGRFGAAVVRGAERMRRAMSAAKQVETARVLRFSGISVEPSARLSGVGSLPIIAALRCRWSSAPALLRAAVNTARSAAISLICPSIEAGAIARPRIRLRCVGSRCVRLLPPPRHCRLGPLNRGVVA